MTEVEICDLFETIQSETGFESKELYQFLVDQGFNQKIFSSRFSSMTSLLELSALEGKLVALGFFNRYTLSSLIQNRRNLKQYSVAIAKQLDTPNTYLTTESKISNEGYFVEVEGEFQLSPELFHYLLTLSSFAKAPFPQLITAGVTRHFTNYWSKAFQKNIQGRISNSKDSFLLLSTDPSLDQHNVINFLKNHGSEVLILNWKKLLSLASDGSNQTLCQINRLRILSSTWIVTTVPKQAKGEDYDALRNLLRIPNVVAIGQPSLQKGMDDEFAIDVQSFRTKQLSNLHLTLWETELRAAGINMDKEDVEVLSGLHTFSFLKIRSIIRDVHFDLNEVSSITLEQISSACRKYSHRAIEKFARRIEPKASLSDLILPPPSKLKLLEARDFIVASSKLKSSRPDLKQSNRGNGVVLVFEGKSGTGKTLAAEVLAKELGVDLYQVDLSSVTSKYIGETEKNLTKIFQAARLSSGILLFDEGESLFSKRTDLKSSQDRYANLETNHLLQEIESYPGVSIISTNLANHIDEAFMRRITFLIKFPRPDLESRMKIWMLHLRAFGEPDSSVNFEFLATLPASGGVIRNVCRHAAICAHSAAEPINMNHILHAIKREFPKAQIAIERHVFGEQYWRNVSLDWDTVMAERSLKELDS